MQSNELWQALAGFRELVVDQMQSSLTDVDGLELSIAQSLTLTQVAHAGPLTVGALQQRLVRSQATTSHLVTQLVKRGFVERVDDPADARRTRVRLAPDGRRLLAKLEKARAAAFERVLGRLPQATRRQLTQALVATVKALKDDA